ncbi:MAG: hypothetical protein HRU10_10955 [Opitutales bacterium]|nr:hypothetical protein [Opitutales bacterium]
MLLKALVVAAALCRRMGVFAALTRPFRRADPAAWLAKAAIRVFDLDQDTKR